MINEQENKASLNKMSDLEYQKNDTEMMRYRVNGLSNKFGLLGMACSVLGAFICLNSFNPKDVQTILIILLNVVVLLGGFLAAEKAKNYSKQGSIAQIAFGCVCIARIFYVPLQLMLNYNNYVYWFKKFVESGDLNDKAKYEEYTNYLGATIINGTNIKLQPGSKETYLVSYLSSDGNFRAILAMIFFAIAGASFITAGVIGYIRAKKLSTYLNSLNEKK